MTAIHTSDNTEAIKQLEDTIKRLKAEAMEAYNNDKTEEFTRINVEIEKAKTELKALNEHAPSDNTKDSIVDDWMQRLLFHVIEKILSLSSKDKVDEAEWKSVFMKVMRERIEEVSTTSRPKS